MHSAESPRNLRWELKILFDGLRSIPYPFLHGLQTPNRWTKIRQECTIRTTTYQLSDSTKSEHEAIGLGCFFEKVVKMQGDPCSSVILALRLRIAWRDQ